MKNLNLATSIFLPINKTPIFVLGNQKTGTSAIASLLGEAAGLSVTIDIPGLYEPVQSNIHKNKINFMKFVLHNRYSFSREIIKEPCLTFLFKELKTNFPDAKYVFVNRDPRNNIRSILNRLSIPGDLSNLEASSFDISPEWQLILDGKWLGLEGKNYIEMLSARWNYTAQIYRDNFQNMTLIRYEDFVKNKIEEIHQLAERLEVKAIYDISSKIDIQYQPAGKNDLAWQDFFGKVNLQTIEKICERNMNFFGYFPSA